MLVVIDTDAVLSAVYFNDEARRVTCEVGDEWT